MAASYLDAVRAYLDRVGWEPATAGDGSVLLLQFKGRNGSWSCEVIERTAEDQLLVYSSHPVPVPPESRPAVVDFINRANTGTVVGNFELDMSDGRLRYKCYVDAASACFTEADAERILTLNVSMMDAYLPGVMRVAAEGMDPAEAVSWVESGGAGQ